MSVRHLDKLFRPASIALIGASERPGSIGSVVHRNLRQGGFKGAVWPVNAGHDIVNGEHAWRDVASLPGVPDLAVICTPAPEVPGLIDQLGRKGTRAAIVISAGLREPYASGATIEQAMLDAARPYLLRILGPNCIGLLVPGLGINASFAPGSAQPGQLAFVTQSGALATAMLDWANGRHIGFSHFISLGDSADVDFGDVLDYLGSDGGTRAILMYAESVKNGRKFMSAARAAARNKPVIVVKSGRAPAGAKAAASHTGALAGSDAVFDAAVRRAGMLRVPTLESLFDAAETLAHRWPYCGERLVVMTNGGGAGVLAADALSLAGGKLATLNPETLASLDLSLPPTWSHGNPVDIIGDAPSKRYVDTLRVLLDAKEVDAILFAHAPTAVVPAAQIADACLPLVKDARKPILGCWLGASTVQTARDMWSQAGIPSFFTPERATDAWLQLVTYARNQAALQQTPSSVRQVSPEREAAQQLIDGTVAAGREWLDEVHAKQVLAAYGIPVVETRMAETADEAANIAAQIGFPVALKVVSPQIVHKSDVGGVVLDLASGQDVHMAAVRMRQDLARHRPDAHVLGFAVQPMVRRHHARELIVGLASDPVFGPVVLCGSGGVDVEVTRRNAVALPPLNTLLAEDLVARSGIKPMLAGTRGRQGADEGALRDVLLKVSRMACELKGLAELDINPLLVDAEGVIALDARIRVSEVPLAPIAIRPYPRQLEEDLAIGGSNLRTRPIRPEDAPRLAAFYEHASPEDMRLRFFLSRREVPHSELARYSQIDYDRDMTFVALAPDGAIAGEVRAVCDPDNDVAEFALQVSGDWQGRGLGKALLAKLVRYLRDRGTKEVTGQCLHENKGMAAIARGLGFTVTSEQDVTAMQMKL
jgi:acetyltransferase